MFKKYSEIENTYNNKKISEVKFYGYDNKDILYVCETKIDGSNFQIGIDENNKITYGYRTRELTIEDNFNNFQDVINRENINEKLIKLKQLISTLITERKFSMIVYGELCGGKYNHKDIEPIKSAIKIQGRISYHPNNIWIPFDILIRTEKINFFIDQLDVVKYCKLVGLNYPIIKYMGTFEECLKYPNDYNDDTGNILYNLPIIEDNITEGIVIKPNKAIYFNNGERVIFKNKNDKFKERQPNINKIKTEISLTPEEEKYLNIIKEYMTESRIYSIISKEGELTNKNFGKILGLTIQDGLNEFNKEYKNIIDNFSDEIYNKQKMKRIIQKDCSDILRSVLFNYVIK